MQYISIENWAKQYNLSQETAEKYLSSGLIAGASCEDGLWRVPQDAQPPLRQKKTFMPIWERPYRGGESGAMLQSLADGEERQVALAAQQYFQANYAEASAQAEACIASESPEIRASALLVHCMACVPLGNTAAAMEDMQMLMREQKNPADAGMQAVYEYIAFLFRIFFHEDGEHAPCVPAGFSALAEGPRFYGLYAYAHALYLSKDYHRALGAAESAIIMAADRYPIVCIYLYLVASMAAMNLSLVELADSYFQRAWALAEPEHYIQPFAEHHGLLQGQVEKFFRNRSQEIYKQISDRVVEFSRGWMKIHNLDSDNQVTDQLTPFEFALAMMAAKGKSNQEIADYQNISINTVKFYLSSIYQKLGVTRRSELEKYLNK